MSDDRYGVWVVTEGWSRESGVDWIGTFEQAVDRARALFTGTATYVRQAVRLGPEGLLPTLKDGVSAPDIR